MNVAGSKKWVNYTILIIFLIVTVLPLVFLLNLSVKSSMEIITGSVLALPEEFHWINYSNAWIQGKINVYFMNSVIITAASSVLTLLLGLPMAYAIARMRWKMSTLTLTVLMAGVMIPIHATLIPLFMTLRKIGLMNSYWSLILPYAASTLPITVYIIRNFLISVPYEMEEAAFIDGCGVIRAFVMIMVPMIKQSLVVVITLNVLTYWNEFVMASTLVTDPRKYTLPIGLKSFSSEYSADFGAIAAGVVISMIPLLLLYLCFTDFLEKGLVAGAMK